MRGLAREVVDLSPHLVDDSVHRRGDAILVMSGYELGQCPRVQLAARGLQSTGKAFRFLKQIIRDGNSSLHTESITVSASGSRSRIVAQRCSTRRRLSPLPDFLLTPLHPILVSGTIHLCSLLFPGSAWEHPGWRLCRRVGPATSDTPRPIALNAEVASRVGQAESDEQCVPRQSLGTRGEVARRIRMMLGGQPRGVPRRQRATGCKSKSCRYRDSRSPRFAGPAWRIRDAVLDTAAHWT